MLAGEGGSGKEKQRIQQTEAAFRFCHGHCAASFLPSRALWRPEISVALMPLLLSSTRIIFKYVFLLQSLHPYRSWKPFGCQAGYGLLPGSLPIEDFLPLPKHPSCFLHPGLQHPWAGADPILGMPTALDDAAGRTLLIVSSPAGNSPPAQHPPGEPAPFSRHCFPPRAAEQLSPGAQPHEMLSTW